VRRSLLLGISQEKKKINPVIKKNLQEANNFQTPISGSNIHFGSG
jgi:hypothetical protein